MSYIINYSGGTITVPINTAVTNTTPLTLIGRNWTSSNSQQGFGQALNQNFVSLLENFANSTQPNSPLKGQFWYDTTSSEMKWNDGTPSSPIWSTVANAIAIAQTIGKGTSNIDIPVADGNINFTVGGISNVMVVTTTGANITGDLDVTTVNATAVTATTLDVTSQITSDTVIANTLQSTINDGITQPLTVATTVKVDNLNADLLDGYHASNVRNTVNAVVVRNVSTGLIDNDINGNVSGSFGNISTINAAALNSSGTVNFTTATQVSLGPVSNIQITGGALGQILTTNGSGVLSWATDTSSLSNGTSRVSIPSINGNINSAVNGINRLIVTSSGANVNGNLNITGASANVNGNLNVTGGIIGNATAVFVGDVTAAANLSVTGALGVTGNIIGGNVSGRQLVSTVTVGTAPLIVTSTTQVANLNAATAGAVTTAAQPNISSVGSLTGLTSGGAVNFTSASNVSLGAVGNVKITGGAAGSILSTDGAGNLSWTIINSILSSIYPIGSIYINAGVNTNPATLLGFGAWVPFGAGRVMVGLNAADPLFDALEETGGSKDATVVSHTHTATSTITDPGHNHNFQRTTQDGTFGAHTPVPGDYLANPFNTNTSTATTGITVATTVASAGSSGTNNNLQPYITVAMWKRTA